MLRVPAGSDERAELAVEVVDGKQGAAVVGLRFICGEIDTLFLKGMAVYALELTPSQCGESCDEIREEGRQVVGHMRTLRMLINGEAVLVAERGSDALIEAVESASVLLNVEWAARVGNAAGS